MTEAEMADVTVMVRELESLIDGNTPEARTARFKMHRLACTTGDEYEEIAPPVSS